MNPDAVQIGQILFTILMFVVGISAVGLLNRFFKRRMERPLAPERDERLDRLEQAVDAIAIEVERISEGQRFTAKLLTERAAPETVARGRVGELGHITPV